MAGAFASSRSVRSTCRALEFSSEESSSLFARRSPQLYFSGSSDSVAVFLSLRVLPLSTTPANIIRINLRATKWRKERCGRRRELSAPITSICLPPSPSFPLKRLDKDGNGRKRTNGEWTRASRVLFREIDIFRRPISI